ncbi:helix-turn-helix transcriptional regulator [Actinomycetospora chiangmaiensis]|uniref:helix-turn-helix transcriptional regulator n=1 Tax=Actinomycetospora chiangmaiensis TaxID=402650 RepID=UPI0012F928B0|nr:helix-turn-helix transcriptional regulator [Actinomycetospora chiangmaiensis]
MDDQRPPAPAAVRREFFTTTDVGRARTHLARDYPDVTFDLTGPSRRYVLDITSLSVGALGIDRIYAGSSHLTRIPGTGGGVWIVHPVRGRYRLEDGRHDVAVEGSVPLCVRPGTSHTVGTEDVSLRVVRLDLAVVAEAAAAVAGIAPESVRFHAPHAISPALARYWTATLQQVVHEVLADDDLLAEPLVRIQAVHALAAAAVAVFPNSALDAVSDPGAPTAGVTAPVTVRRAVAYIDEHAAEPITLGDIAAAARVGPRALQIAFRRHRDETPLDHLRRVRLHRAHLDLQAADPTGGDTVGRIAARWGFTHSGRFSAAHRRTYGTSPSAVLPR